MTLYAAPICVGCTRFHGYRTPTREQFERAELVTGTCDAYPEGIPLAIWQGSHDHRKPFTGDHTLRFKAKDADAERYAELMFEGYEDELAAAAAAEE